MAVNKVTSPYAVTTSQTLPITKSVKFEPQSIFVKGDKKQHQVFLSAIVYIEALGKYSILHFKSDKIITQQTMSGFEELLPKQQFIRVHKCYIVAKAKVQAIESAHLQLQSKIIPIGQSFKKPVNEWIKYARI